MMMKSWHQVLTRLQEQGIILRSVIIDQVRRMCHLQILRKSFKSICWSSQENSVFNLWDRSSATLFPLWSQVKLSLISLSSNLKHRLLFRQLMIVPIPLRDVSATSHLGEIYFAVPNPWVIHHPNHYCQNFKETKKIWTRISNTLL
jgi:hypothetical protein